MKPAVDATIFRKYDIRGIYPTQVNENVYRDIGIAFARIFCPSCTVVARDARSSSSSLSKALISGLTSTGVDVIDIGGATSDMLYYAVNSKNCGSGMMVTASHNPWSYNGLKLVGPEARAIAAHSGLSDIRDVLLSGSIETPTRRKGKVTTTSIVEEYVDFLLQLASPAGTQGIRLALDSNGGYVSLPLAILVDKLGLNVVMRDADLDRRDLRPAPNPTLTENHAAMTDLVMKSGSEVGVSWDLDADRVVLFDDQGNFISPAYVAAALADILLAEKSGGATLIVDPRVVWPIQEVAARRNANLIVSRSGHGFMKERMRQESALFGGELSAHFYFQDTFFADNGILPLLILLKKTSEKDRPLCELFVPYAANHFLSGELNFNVSSNDLAINACRKSFDQRGAQHFVDGYSVETANWRFNIRASNTEPLLRLNIEARTESLLAQVHQEIIGIIGQYVVEQASERLDAQREDCPNLEKPGVSPTSSGGQHTGGCPPKALLS